MSTSVKKNNLLIILLSGLRHRLLVYFRPRYTIDSLLKRKGKCQACGQCCLLNKPWCRYFKEGKCQVYDQQPFFCKIFPIDEKDKDMSGVAEKCGCYWDQEDSK